MTVQVRLASGEYRIDGDWAGAGAGNAFLVHLRARAFSPATIRAYAFDVVNLARFLDDQGIGLAEVTAADIFAWVDWQGARRDGPAGSGKVVALRPRTAAASTVNRRVAAVRAFFEYLVMTGALAGNPVPSPRRGQGLRPVARGLLDHLGPGRSRGGGRLVRQPRRLPESLPASEVDAFVSSLRTHRDRAMALAMLLGGLRSAEVRGLKLADADMGRRRLRVIDKGGKERHVPAGKPIIPDKVSWLNGEMLKTRVAHGYCSRHEAAGPCPYANICETCDNFVTGPEFRVAIHDQLTDVQHLQADAGTRGRDGDAARHARVAEALTGHLERLGR